MSQLATFEQVWRRSKKWSQQNELMIVVISGGWLWFFLSMHSPLDYHSINAAYHYYLHPSYYYYSKRIPKTKIWQCFHIVMLYFMVLFIVIHGVCHHTIDIIESLKQNNLSNALRINAVPIIKQTKNAKATCSVYIKILFWHRNSSLKALKAKKSTEITRSHKKSQKSQQLCHFDWSWRKWWQKILV